MPGAETTAAVVDASVAVKWVVVEVASDQAAMLLAEPIAWLAPRLLLAEAAAALRRKVSTGELRSGAAVAGLAALLDAVDQGTIRLADDDDLVANALGLALTHAHKIPDCVYVALAEREGTALSTADVKLAELARRRKVPVLGIGAVAN